MIKGMLIQPAQRSLRGRLHFRGFSEDYHYGKLISKRFHNGDWHWWFVIDWCMDESGNDDAPKYYVSLNVVSPEAAGLDGVCEAGECQGIPDEDWAEGWVKEPCHLVELLVDYGSYATMAMWSGDNLRELLKQARDEAGACSSLFGFYMDRGLNGLGATGWDLVAGNTWGSLDMGSKRERTYPAPMVAAVSKILTRLQRRTKRLQAQQY